MTFSAWWMGIPSGSSRMTARRAPQSCSCSAQPREAVADRAFHAAPSLRHVEVTTGIRHAGAAAWQACQQLQIVKLPPSVISLAEGAFLGCCVLREVAARVSDTVQGVCRVLLPESSWGQSWNRGQQCLAPGAQLGKYAFESCLTLATTPLTLIILTNLEDRLKGRSAAQALNSSACPVTSTISGRVPVRIVKVASSGI